MNEQTTLNAEQEAFLAYQAASSKRNELNQKVSSTFAAYADLSKDARIAFESYTKLQESATTAYAEYRDACDEANEMWNNTGNLYNEWVKVRGY